MVKIVLIAMALAVIGCSSQKFYVVRHAEKAVVTKDSASMMANNPPLSEPGKVRAIVLKEELKNEDIRHIFSTNTIRTTSTAQPLAELKNMQVQLYSSAKDSIAPFISMVKSLKGNVLIVGHSNTVDDLVNALTARTELPADLPDTEYDNLFIITKKGKRWLFEKRKYGYPSNP